MKRVMKAVLALPFVAGAAAVYAQTAVPQQSPTFRTSTQRVEVDVAVTDASGRPMRGLTRGDFTIPGQTIVEFQEVSRRAAGDSLQLASLRVPHDVADNVTALSSTLVLILLDDRVPALERKRMRDTAREVVDRVGDGVFIGLLSTTGRLAFELTDDRSRLLDAIDRLQWNTTEQRTTRMVTGSCDFALLEQAARMLAPLPAQRKAIVAVTPGCGLPIKGSVDSMAALDAWPTEPPAHVAVRAVDIMRRANVAYYAVDPRGKVGFSLSHFQARSIMGQMPEAPDGDHGASPQSLFSSLRNMEAPGSPMTGKRSVPSFSLRHDDPVIQSQETLESVSSATGGFAVTNTDDIEGGIDRLVNDLDHYYVLGFTPSSTKNGFHDIKVTVNADGAVLRYRRGYQLDGVNTRSKGLDPLPTINGVLPVADVPLRLMAMPFALKPGRVQELFAIEVRAPRALLADANGKFSDDLSVTVAAVNTTNASVDHAFAFKRHIAIAPAFAGSGDTIAYQIMRGTELPAGHYQFRVSVESAKLKRTGSVYISVDVPESSEADFDLGGPLISYANADRHPAAATVIDTGLPVIAPLFDRVFDTGDELRVYCPILTNNSAATDATIELVDVSGKTVSTSTTAISTSLSALDATLSLNNVRSGAYRLRVTADAGNVKAVREIGIAVR